MNTNMVFDLNKKLVAMVAFQNLQSKARLNRHAQANREELYRKSALFQGRNLHVKRALSFEK